MTLECGSLLQALAEASLLARLWKIVFIASFGRLQSRHAAGPGHPQTLPLGSWERQHAAADCKV